MATGGVRRVYEEDDRVDEYLLNQLSKWILYHRLGVLARDLGISNDEFTWIATTTSKPEEQIFKILQTWHNKTLLTVKDLVVKMVRWTQGGLVNRYVWDHFPIKVNPAALPSNVQTLQLPTPPTGPHPLQLALMQALKESDGHTLDSQSHVEEEQYSSTNIKDSSPPTVALQQDPSAEQHLHEGTMKLEQQSAVILPGAEQCLNSFTSPEMISQKDSLNEVAPAGNITLNEPNTSFITAEKISAGCIATAQPSAVSNTGDQPSQASITAAEMSIGLLAEGQPFASSIVAGEMCIGSTATIQPSEGSIATGQMSAQNLNVGKMFVGALTKVQPSVPTEAGQPSLRQSHHKPRTIFSQCICSPEIDDIKDFKMRLKESLRRTLKDCLKHDWLEEGVNFPLMKYYTDLVWVRMVKEAMGKEKKTMKGMDEIIQVPGAGKVGLNVLVQAKPGMGKTCSMAKLSMMYAEGKKKFPFDFVFFIPLRNVEDNCSLTEIIIAEHDQLGKEDTGLIQAVIKGKTEYKALLLLDGYDEYTPGTNSEIDQALEKTVGKCFIILTSRPIKDKHFTENIKRKMDGEVIIEGFSHLSIQKCCSLYLGSKDECDQFLAEVEKQTLESNSIHNWGLKEILKIPIMLLMMCVLYKENEEKVLPGRKTQVYDELYQLVMDRTTLKSNNFGCESSQVPNIDVMLITLGKFAWEALQDDVKQLLLDKEDLEKECPNIMKLGLLSVVNKTTASTKIQRNYVSFAHKSFQEFGASKFICHRLETAADIKGTLGEIFSSWTAVKRHKEVVIFTVGLMKDPTPLVNHIYKVYIEDYMVKIQEWDCPIRSRYLFQSVYKESAIKLPGHPLHNQHINNYNHEYCLDIIPVYPFSKLYAFHHMKEAVVCNMEPPEHNIEVPECTIVVHEPHEFPKQLLSSCQSIQKHQAAKNLLLNGFGIKDFSKPGFNLSKNAECIVITSCNFPIDVMNDLMQQLSKCKYVRKLELSGTHLGESVYYLVQALRSWGDNPQLLKFCLANCSIPQDVLDGMFQFLSSCNCLTALDLSFNTLTGSLSSFLPDPHPGLPHLKCLYLDNTALTKDDLNHLLSNTYKLPNLQYFRLCGNTLTGCLSNFLSDPHPGLPQLKILYLIKTGLTKQDLQHFSCIAHKLPKLRELNLSKNTLTRCLSSFLPNPYPGFPQLEELDLSDTALSKEDLQHFSNITQSNKLPKLKKLDLLRNTGCLSSFVPDPHPGLPQLTELIFHSGLNEEDTCHLLRIAHKFPKLISLDLIITMTGCFSNFLQDTKQGLPELLSLNLPISASNKDDLQHLTHIIQSEKLPALSRLCLSFNRPRKIKKEIGQLIEAVIHHYRDISLEMRGTNLPESFEKKWERRCEGTKVKVYFLLY